MNVRLSGKWPLLRGDFSPWGCDDIMGCLYLEVIWATDDDVRAPEASIRMREDKCKEKIYLKASEV